MAPLVSVVMTHYNQPEPFLRECLESLLAQTLPEWEGIVVDDGSSRGDAEGMLRDLHDPRFKFIRHEKNRGLGAARNTGIQAAQSSMIALLDADDRFGPEFLKTTLHALHDHPEAHWVAVDWQVFGARDWIWPFPVHLSMNCPAHFLFAGAGMLMRKSVWEMTSGYSEDETMSGGEDWDFWIAVAERGLRPTHVAQPLYFYRMHAGARSLTSSRYNEWRFRDAIYRRHKLAFESIGLDCPKCPTVKKRVSAFLAQGFLVSSDASLRKGERLRAVELAIRALTLQPKDLATLKQVARSILPRKVLTVLRKGKRRSDVGATRTQA